MRNWLIVVALVVGFGGVAEAQQAKGASWTQPPEVVGDTPQITANKAAAYKQTLQVDTLSADLLAVSCSVVNAAAVCTGQLPPVLITQLGVVGPHRITLTSSNGIGSATGDTLVMSIPTKPINLTFTITVTINITP